MGTYPSQCRNCGTEFIWFSGNTSGMCAECRPYDTSSYVQIPAISSDYNELMKDAEALVKALETAEAAIAVFTISVYGRYTPEDESFREVNKALATWNAKYGSKK